MMFEFKENILATLAYYDVFDFPLKAGEILARLVNFKHLQGSGFRCQVSGKMDQESCTLAEIKRKLDQLVLGGIANRVGDYYFLFDREYLVPLRLKREKIAERKWWIAKRAIRRLRFVPYLRAVFASGSLAMSNTDELSDLDVLVVVKHGRIWLVRLLVTALLSVLRVRRRGHDRIAPNKICLNHYITDKLLNIPHGSIYNAQTYANLVPIFVSDWKLVDDFEKANNWVLDYVGRWNINKDIASPYKDLRCPYNLLERFLEISGLGKFLNNLARKYQSKRIADNPVTHQAGGRVIFTDEQLEFHPHSIETQIVSGYNERLLKLNLPQLAVEKDSGLDKDVP